MSGDRVVVVGGGAIGTSCAYYLAKSGFQVTLIDQDRQGAGATAGNCGLMAYSHILPLCAPGAVKKALKAIGWRNSAFSIKPRFDPALWSWLLHFARCSNKDAMLASARARAALIESSSALYRQLFAEEQIDCEHEERGCLFIFKTQQEMDHYAETDRFLSDVFNVPASRYDGDALVEFEPACKPGAAAGGWMYEQDEHVRPEALLRSWRLVLDRMGVTILEHCEVKRIVRNEKAAFAVATSNGEISADVFVMATGAWTPLLNKELACRVPIQPGKGYSITMPRPERCPKVPIIFHEDKVVVTPMQSAYRLGSTMEFAGYDDSIRKRRIERLKTCAAKYLHEPYTEPVSEEWFGWRPMTYDGVPIISRTPALHNVFIAAGHNMLGLTLAPATGKLIAEMVTEAPTHVDAKPFSMSRF